MNIELADLYLFFNNFYMTLNVPYLYFSKKMKILNSLFYFIFLSFHFISCAQIDKKDSKIVLKEHNIQLEKRKTSTYPGLEKLTEVIKLDSTIQVSLKYATLDNFTKKILYTEIYSAYLQNDVALGLVKSNQYLKMRNPNLRLLIYDAVRPASVQKLMWDALDTIPILQRRKFVSDPSKGSLHNYGCAVDITICDQKGQPLDMGSPYDDINLIAYPIHENRFLNQGLLSVAQIKNRELLRETMRIGGFSGIKTEWWHFNACSLKTAALKYPILK